MSSKLHRAQKSGKLLQSPSLAEFPTLGNSEDPVKEYTTMRLIGSHTLNYVFLIA